MSSKKIAICCAQIPFFHGGAERLAEALQIELLKKGLDVELINIPFKWYPPSRLLKECMIWRMLDLSESWGEKIDIVICTKFPSTVINHHDKRIWLIHQHRPIYDLYGTTFSDFNSGKREDQELRDMLIEIDNKTLSEARRIFCISKNVCKRLKKFNNLDSKCLYPPAANADRFFHAEYGDYILYVGRLEPKKRVELLIDALKVTNTRVKCMIVGTGEEEDRLKEIASDPSIDGRVRFLGPLPDDEVIKLYANALAVFYAPFDEDYGFVTIESFLSRKPVVTTMDSGGVLEFVRDGENGFVLSTEARAIAEKLDWFYENRKKCNEFGMNGYEAVKKLSWDYVIERLID